MSLSRELYTSGALGHQRSPRRGGSIFSAASRTTYYRLPDDHRGAGWSVLRTLFRVSR